MSRWFYKGTRKTRTKKERSDCTPFLGDKRPRLARAQGQSAMEGWTLEKKPFAYVPEHFYGWSWSAFGEVEDLPRVEQPLELLHKLLSLVTS